MKKHVSETKTVVEIRNHCREVICCQEDSRGQEDIRHPATRMTPLKRRVFRHQEDKSYQGIYPPRGNPVTERKSVTVKTPVIMKKPVRRRKYSP